MTSCPLRLFRWRSPPSSARFTSMAFLLPLCWIASSCGRSPQSPAAEQPQTLTLTGSSTGAPLVAEIGKQYEAQHPQVRVDVQTGGSSRGIADVRSGVADIGLVSRDLTEAETDLASFAVARDGIGLIVHSRNPVKTLSDQQIREIFRRQITNWRQLGGQDAPITVVNKAQGRSTLELFESYFQFGPKDIKADVVIGDNQQGLKTVAANPHAIGYVSIGAATVEIDRGEPIKLLPLEGVPATLQTVQDGSFPLSRTLNLVTKGTPTPQAREFIEFATSPPMAATVKRQFFVPPES
ncbi:phosphate ABC transporter substrate-binding protein [Lyngbya confervoides]|uniref:Phosphate ABC transporter substrate-binding protein n=1 Tax=Lyngbya confervoides BDU141951 TaxID=1574623 RepID=A0ABD4T4G5_9CYAN|nr:phosphate ABC transporter substrate-binding protein [Lyngbya confervoides]MCM1983340.1 phosphate ABC transporter substrate-binding protein [Lyngbya confervoides BDU141951]